MRAIGSWAAFSERGDLVLRSGLHPGFPITAQRMQFAMPAPPIGTSDDGPRDNNISATTGLTAIVLPAGMTAGGLPIAIEILGRPFSESRLIELAHASEQASRARVAPRTTPALSCNVFVF